MSDIDCMTDWFCECGDLNREHEAGCYRCGAGRPEPYDPPADEFTGPGSCSQEDDYLRAHARTREAAPDPMGDGVLLVAHREGVTARPDIEASLIARNLLYTATGGQLHLTAAGRKHLRARGLL